jgi:uncharacterized protein (DUF58 family)
MRWLVGAILVLCLAILLDFGLLAYAMYALLGVMVVSRVMADRWSAQLVAERRSNREEVELGDKVAVVVTLENRGWLPIPWLLVEDLLPRRAMIHNPPNLEPQGRRLQLLSFRGRGRKTLLYQLTCNRRGYYQIGPLVVETGDVFGLYRRYRVLSEPSFLLAYPKVAPLEGYHLASRRPIGEVRMSHRLFEDPTRIAGVRSYQAGDPLNRIHWGATAATGLLHSKVYEPSTIAGATILLDFHRDAFDPRHEPVRSELAVTTAASLAGALCEMGQQVGLVTNARDAAERIRTSGWSHEQLASRQLARQSASMRDESDRLRPQVVATARGNVQLRQILQTLARAEQTNGLTFAQLVQETTSRIPASATVIAILTKVTPAAAVSLGNLRRRGFAVTAIVNIFDQIEYAEASALLMAERIETRQLRDEAALPTVCSQTVWR